MCRTPILSSRRFVVWRYVYTVALALLAAPFLITNNIEVGNEPGILLLVLGVLPSVVYLVAMKLGWQYANMVAYAHDSLLVVGSIVLLVVLPNYFAFVFLAPLVGFAVEWIIASYCILSARRAVR